MHPALTPSLTAAATVVWLTAESGLGMSCLRLRGINRGRDRDGDRDEAKAEAETETETETGEVPRQSLTRLCANPEDDIVYALECDEKINYDDDETETNR